MDLKLGQVEGVNKLSVSGDIDLKSLSVLSAGISKLMRDGKDRIVLDLSGVTSVPDQFVHQISELARITEELTGQIVLSGLSDSTKSELMTLSESPPFRVFDTAEQAVEYLNKVESEAEELPESVSELLRQKDREIESLQNRIKIANPEEVRNLRKESALLRQVNEKLEDQITKLLKERRLPPDPDAVETKIAHLEKYLKEMTASVQEGAGNAKK